MVVAVQQVSLGIANGNVNPGQFCPGLVRFYNFGNVLLNYLIEPTIARKAVRSDFGVRVKATSGNRVDGFSSLVRHNFHFKELATKYWSLILLAFNFLRFCHHQNGRLFFAASTAFCRLLLNPFKLRINGCKEPVIHFYCSRKFLFLIPGTHSHPKFLHHIPNRFIPLSPELPLHFAGREPFLGGGHKMGSKKPIPKGQIGRFHNCTTSQSGAGSTRLSLKLTNAFHPIMFSPFAFTADNSLFLTLFPVCIPARLLVGQSCDKIYKLHNHYFDSKLQG